MRLSRHLGLVVPQSVLVAPQSVLVAPQSVLVAPLIHVRYSCCSARHSRGCALLAYGR